jgi:hypothetical protein
MQVVVEVLQQPSSTESPEAVKAAVQNFLRHFAVTTSHHVISSFEDASMSANIKRITIDSNQVTVLLSYA